MKWNRIKRVVYPILAVFGGIALLVLLFVAPHLGRWWDLQRAGCVPEGINRNDPEGDKMWRIAEWTTWWGDPLDPKVFWKDRVVWNDRSAEDAARRRGRGYPPIPTHLTNLCPAGFLSHRSHKDIVPGPWSGGLDGGRVTPFHFSDAENAYWNWFWRHQPKPPPTLQREQYDAAERILSSRRPLIIRGRDLHAEHSPGEHKQIEQTLIDRAKEIGVPKEALNEDALFWAYVLKQRQEYTKEQAQADRLRARASQIADGFLTRFMERLLVDPKLITDPLTPDQLKDANAWKIAYLQRLRREKTDESYITAYLKAWNLTEAEVFPAK